MHPPQRLGIGVSSKDTGYPSPSEEMAPPPESKEEQQSDTTVPLITDDDIPHSTPTGATISTKGDWQWEKYPSHEQCLKNASYRRVESTHVRVFDLSVEEHAKAFAELLDANTTQSIKRKEGLKNRVKFKATPTMYPPDPGKTNVRVLAAWDVFEFVVLDPATGFPLVSSS